MVPCCFAVNDRLFPELEEADVAERDRAAEALQSLADSVRNIRSSDDPLLRAIRSLNKTYRGTGISLDNIFSWYGIEIATAQRNALLQRDDALVTRWWSLKWKLPTLLEFFLALVTRHGVFFHGANALALVKKIFPLILFQNCRSKK